MSKNMAEKIKQLIITTNLKIIEVLEVKLLKINNRYDIFA